MTLKHVTLGQWHLATLVQELSYALDSEYKVSGLAHSRGIRLSTHWTTKDAEFYLSGPGEVQVRLCGGWTAVEKHLLTTVILRVFHWDQKQFTTHCCGLVKFKLKDDLFFVM